MGAIGCFYPFPTPDDIEFFHNLEMHLRQENPPLCGRDHMAYRGYYFPIKACVDGELCEQYTALDPSKQRAIGSELERTPTEVAKKLEDVRNKLL